MKVLKTIKLFAGGKFIRSESGRSYSVNKHNTQEQYARLCQSSRKDFRNTVEVAIKGYQTWSKATPFNRSQILYRLAEMCEGKREEFISVFKTTLGMSDAEATKTFESGRDTFVYYAGFCDKYQQLSGAVNPVSGPFHNFTSPAPTGVVTVLESDNFNFQESIDGICSAIVGGNSVIVLLSSGCPAVLAPLSETIATSDVPAGVINLLTGSLEELHEFIGGHRDVRAISFQSEDQVMLKKIQELGVDNMKRIIPRHKETLCLQNILNYCEYKTVWHPIGS